MSTLDGTIAFFRRRRAEQFRATCLIERRGGPGAFNEDTGEYETPIPQVVYEGACNVREATWIGTDVRSGERELRLQRGLITLPHDTATLEDDVLIVLTASEDASLVDREYRLTDVRLDAWQTIRSAIGERIGMEEAS